MKWKCLDANYIAMGNHTFHYLLSDGFHLVTNYYEGGRVL